MHKQQAVNEQDEMRRHVQELVYNYLYGDVHPTSYMTPNKEHQTETHCAHAVAGGADGHED